MIVNIHKLSIYTPKPVLFIGVVRNRFYITTYKRIPRREKVTRVTIDIGN